MDQDEVARQIEPHEADMWCRMVTATAQVPGNPLGARVGREGQVPLFSLTALNAPLFNRVVSLGVTAPADDAELDRVLDWFAGLGQTRFWIEVTPVAQPAALRERLAERGLAPIRDRMAKTWCEPRDVAVDPRVTIEELTADDRDAFAACNMAAWGVPDALRSWFGATVGVDGFRHFGVREEGRVVSTGTLFVSDAIAWLGFGATYPESRGRGYQTALLAYRIREAWRLGCRIAHSETSEETTEEPNASLRNMHRVGMETIYAKESWAPDAKA